jgi:hypothetical protein
MSALGAWYDLMDLAPWWLMKATGVAWGMEFRQEANKSEFETWSSNVECVYSDEVSDAGARRLTFISDLHK